MGNPHKRKKALRIANAIMQQTEQQKDVKAALTPENLFIEEEEKLQPVAETVQAKLEDVKPSKKKKVSVEN